MSTAIASRTRRPAVARSFRTRICRLPRLGRVEDVARGGAVVLVLVPGAAGKRGRELVAVLLAGRVGAEGDRVVLVRQRAEGERRVIGVATGRRDGVRAVRAVHRGELPAVDDPYDELRRERGRVVVSVVGVRELVAGEREGAVDRARVLAVD